MTSPDTPSAAPKMFGRYEVLRRLGRGAVGEVFLARDTVLGREVAVKTLANLDALSEDEQADARARFLREARAAAGLSHPNIVTIHDVGESAGVPFIAMEYLRGTTLDRYTKPGHTLPPEKVLEIGVQAAAALDEAHRRQIVHRDIKPANLVLLEDGTVKVADFGLAKAPGTGLTAAETLLGTPNYMSPEQIGGKDLDGRSDLFSLAVSLFELLAGKRPFPGETITSVLYRIVNEPPLPLSELRPDLPAGLETFFGRAFEKDPAARPPDAASFGEALAAILRGMGGVPPGIRLPPPAERAAANSAPVARSTPASRTQAEPPGERTERLRRAEGERSKRGLVLGGGAGLVALAVFGIFVAPGLLGAREHVVRLEGAADLRIAVSGGGARLEGAERIVVPAGQKDPVTVTATDARGCREARHVLAPGAWPEVLRLELQQRSATVRVDSDPPGAEVTVGDDERGPAPQDLPLEACKEYKVVLAAPGRRAVTVQLAADERVEDWVRKLQRVALPAGAAPPAPPVPPAPPPVEEKPRFGTIVLSEPSGYEAAVVGPGGKRLGRAGTAMKLATGRQTLELVAPGVMLRDRVEITVEGGRSTQPIAYEWPRLGRLQVRAVPPGGDVFIASAGGEKINAGTSDDLVKELVAGSYTVTVKNPVTGAEVSRRVDVTAGGTAQVSIRKQDWP